MFQKLSYSLEIVKQSVLFESTLCTYVLNKVIVWNSFSFHIWIFNTTWVLSTGKIWHKLQYFPSRIHVTTLPRPIYPVLPVRRTPVTFAGTYIPQLTGSSTLLVRFFLYTLILNPSIPARSIIPSDKQ